LQLIARQGAALMPMRDWLSAFSTNRAEPRHKNGTGIETAIKGEIIVS